MKSRMEKYYDNNVDLQRSKRNNDLYGQSDNVSPSTSVNLLDNVSEIDMSKIKDLFNSREGYQRIKNFDNIISKQKEEVTVEEENDYDIYEDIENKIYDINSILEEARKKRGTIPQDIRKKLRNTQYNILTKLELNNVEEALNNEEDEMEVDLFDQDKDLKKLIEKTRSDINISKENVSKPSELTSQDLFASLKSVNEDTVLTVPLNDKDIKVNKIELENKTENTFYTDNLAFTKGDFEEFHNLQSTVKSNNKLIKVLIIILVIVILITAGYIIYTSI